MLDGVSFLELRLLLHWPPRFSDVWFVHIHIDCFQSCLKIPCDGVLWEILKHLALCCWGWIKLYCVCVHNKKHPHTEQMGKYLFWWEVYQRQVKFEVLTDIVKRYWNPLFSSVHYVCSKLHFFIRETTRKLALRVAKQQLLHLAVYSLSYYIYPPITVMTGLFPVSCFRWCLTNSSPAGKIVNGAFENAQGRARHIPLAEAHLCDSTEPENMSKCNSFAHDRRRDFIRFWYFPMETVINRIGKSSHNKCDEWRSCDSQCVNAITHSL